jgi:hypothetical protein
MIKQALYATAIFVASHASGAAQTATSSAAPDGTFAMPTADWLLVQMATSISYDGKVLTLKGVAPATIMFTDRPQRMTANAPTQAIVDDWGKGPNSFEMDPPNANLSVLKDGKEQSMIVELSNPKLDGDTLTYAARLLDGDVPKSDGAGTLVIDWWMGVNGGICRHYGPWHVAHCVPSFGHYPRTAPN